MNELITLTDHIHNILSSVLIKYHTGIELTEDEEEIVSQLYIANEEGYLKSLEDIPYKVNNHINTIIMSRTKGSKNKKSLILNNENMGKLDLNAEVLSLDGKTIKGESATDNLTIKKAIKFAILNSGIDKKTPEEKYGVYKLAMKLESQDQDFTVEELASFKKAIGEVFNPEIVGFIWDAIDGK